MSVDAVVNSPNKTAAMPQPLPTDSATDDRSPASASSTNQQSSSFANLSKSASQAVITLLTPNQIDHLTETFRRLDLNQDGFVDKEEIANMLEATFPDSDLDVLKELQELIMEVADRDHDGKINLKEYLMSIASEQGVLPTHVEVLDEQVQSIMSHLSSEEIDMFRDAFIRLDQNGDGFVDREEMMDAVEKVVGDRFEALKVYLDKIYDVADKDVDGKLNLTEFLASFAEGPGVVPHEVVISSVRSVRIRLTDDEIASLQESFNTIDRNCDGLIDAAELREAFKRSAVVRRNPDITEAEVDAMVERAMQAADQDRDGYLTLAEFIRSYQEDQQVLPEIFTISAVQRIHSALSQDELEFLREAFAELDENGDGWIDEEELTHSLTTTLSQVLRNRDEVANFIRLIIASADRNDDGKLSLGEFIEAFASGSAALDIPLIVAGERIQTALNELRDMMLEEDVRKLSNVFVILDQNKDGYLEREELECIMASLIRERYPSWSPEHVDRVITAILSAADTNHDGKLSLSEFIRSFYEGYGILPEEFVEDVANAVDEALEDQENDGEEDEEQEEEEEEEEKEERVEDSQAQDPNARSRTNAAPSDGDAKMKPHDQAKPCESTKPPVQETRQASEQPSAATPMRSSTGTTVENGAKETGQTHVAPAGCQLESVQSSPVPQSSAMTLFPNDVTGCPVTNEQLWNLFRTYDTNGNNLLNRAEFMKLYRSFECYGLPPTDREINEIFSKYDRRRDGNLDFNEFAIIMLQRSRM